MHRPTLFVAVLLTAFAPTLSADTIRVPKDAATLQAAVDLAGDGDEILVSSGRYTGNVLVQGFDGLRIVGKGKVVLDGSAEDLKNDTETLHRYLGVTV